MGAVIPIHNRSLKKERYIIDDNVDVLTQVYDENINLAIYERNVTAEVIQYAQKILNQEKTYSFIHVVNLDNVKQKLKVTLPDHDFRDSFINDLHNICEMYTLLFDLEKIGLRLSVLEHAMCPRFHVDNIPCRLLTTYGDTGTEWLSEDNLDRSKLGRGNNGKPDEMSRIYFDESQINRLKPYDIALLKGEAWPNNAGKAAVHRSPAVNKLKPRLLFSLDFI